MVKRLLSFAKTALLCGLLLAPAVRAEPIPAKERVDPMAALPKALANVDVKEHLGRALPKGLGFRDQTGRPVTLDEYFDGTQPVIFTFNYSNCPMLCSLMLNGLVEGLKDISYTPGRDFRIVSVSIDHTETPDRALRTQRRYLGQYGRPEAKDAWHFLTGSEANVKAYADALGFSYAWIEERKEYAHPSAIALASPDGRIVRYLYGMQYEPDTLKLALLESSQGKIGNTLDRLILYCFHYDSSAGRYAPVAARIMKVGAAASVLILAGLLFVLWRADRRKKLRRPEPAESV